LAVVLSAICLDKLRMKLPSYEIYEVVSQMFGT